VSPSTEAAILRHGLLPKGSFRKPLPNAISWLYLKDAVKATNEDGILNISSGDMSGERVKMELFEWYLGEFNEGRLPGLPSILWLLNL